MTGHVKPLAFVAILSCVALDAAAYGDKPVAICLQSAVGADADRALNTLREWAPLKEFDIRTAASGETEGCEAIVRLRASEGFWNGVAYRVDVLSARSHALLWHSDENGLTQNNGTFQSQIFTLFLNGPVYDQIVAERQAAAAPRPAAAPAYTVVAQAAAPAVTREDMQKIAQDAARQAAQEATRDRAPAAPAEKRVVSDVDAPKFRDPARPNDVAVVVGVEKYNDLPDAAFAERDALSVRDYALALGFAPRNVILLTGNRASRAEIMLSVERRLPKMVRPDSTVFFYYSGHGAPDPATGKAYLLPADGDPEYLEDTAYPVARLKAKLGELKARSVLIALDSCFSGAGGRSVVPKGTRPLVTRVDEGATPARVTALTASGANEIAGSLDEQGHGAFTYYFLKGLSGGRRSFQKLYEYTKPNVEDAARLKNRAQSPMLTGPDASL